jgi:hypothetical protein
MSEAPRAPETPDGAHDFDFLFGRWAVANRKLRDPLATAAEEWVEFTASAETRPILAGLGNIDSYSAPEFPGRGRFEGMTLRLFDSAEGVWRIWWASTATSGMLDTPVVGRFVGEHGVFECDDVLEGRELRVRYEWFRVSDGEARWQQSFSFDASETWQPNWYMTWRRAR